MIWEFQRTLGRRLLLWAGLSVGFGLVWLGGAAEWWKGFGFQALAWGVVDGVIALFGLRGLAEKIARPVELALAERDARRLRLILWANAGLDVLYIGGGLVWALVWAQDDFAAGNGWGVVVQGAFLLLFDVLHALAVPDEISPPEIDYFRGQQHERFEAQGGKPAALLVHGFPGSPNEMLPLAGALHEAGWTVCAPLLPGFAGQLSSLYQQRVSGWVDYVVSEVQRLRAAGHAPVVLIGYSMGAGLSIPAAVRSQPDAVVLLAPFWQPFSWLQKVLAGVIRLFLPAVLRPLRRADLRRGRMRAALEQFVPELNWDDGVVQTGARRFGLPLVFVEQVQVLSEAVQQTVRALQVPVLVMQAQRDPVVRPVYTRRLMARFSGSLRFVTVDGEHNMTLPEHPGYAVVRQTVLDFCRMVVEK